MDSHKESEEDDISIAVAEESVGTVSLRADVAAFCAWYLFTWSLN